MQNKPRKHMGIGLIALSMVFLWNPDITVFDLLPDVIGYILLSLGLSSLSYLNHHFEESAKRFHRMIPLSAARLVFVLILFGRVSHNDRPTTMLLGSFVFGVLELMTLLPAYKQLFEGFTYAGARGGIGESVFRPTLAHRFWSLFIKRKSEFDQRNTAVTVTESTALLTSLFVISKVTLNALPEFTVLTEGSDDVVNLYRFVWLFRVVAVLVGAVIGLVWLLMIMRYLIGIFKDKPYVTYLHTRYMEDIYPNHDLFVAKRYKLGSFFLLLGICLSLDLPMEGINVLPDVLSAICLIAGILVLRHYLKSYKPCVLVLCAYGIVSAVDSIWQIHYFYVQEYSAKAALNGGEATSAYVVSIILSVICSAMFVLVVANLLSCLKDIIREHTGYEVKHTDMQSYGKLGALHKQLIRGLIPVLVLAVICAVGNVAYTVLLPYSGIGGEWYRIIASTMWLVNLALGVVLVVVFAEKNHDIAEQINNRYLLSTPASKAEQTE